MDRYVGIVNPFDLQEKDSLKIEVDGLTPLASVNFG